MKERNDVSHVLRSSRNTHTGGQLEGLALETFKHFDVDLEKVKCEVNILNFEMLDYEEKINSSVFGEKKSISYTLHFITYNVEFKVKLLTFEYKVKYELLKLDIDCKTPDVKKEITYCCNSLQRKRNLNLMFITLVSFARYLESRRLICDLVLRKNQDIKIEENKDGGQIVVYSDEKRNIKLAVFWSVEYNSEHEVIDKVEVYYKVAELSNRDDIKNKLTYLTEPHLAFNQKYHLWKELLKALSNDEVIVVDSVSETDYDATCSNSEDISIIRYPNCLFNKANVKMEDVKPDVDVADISSSTKTLPNDQNSLVCIKNSKLLSKNTKEASIILLDNEELVNQFADLKKPAKPNLRDGTPSHIVYIDSLDAKNIEEKSRVKCGKRCSSTITSSASSSKEFPVLNPLSSAKQNHTLQKSHSSAFDKRSLLCPNCTKGECLSDFRVITTTTAYDDATRTASIELTDTDTESVIALASDTEDKEENEIRTSSSKKETSVLDFSKFNSSNATNTVISGIPERSMPGNQIVPDSTARNGPTIIELDLLLPPKRPKIVDDDLEITGVTYVIPD